MIADWNTVILSKIKNILSKMDKQNDATESISTDISFVKDSVSNISSSISALNTNINDYIGDTKSVIKNLQRGVINISPLRKTSVSLSGFTNSDKMVAFITGTGISGSVVYGLRMYIESVSVDTLTLNTSNPGVGINTHVGYTVIEFY